MKNEMKRGTHNQHGWKTQAASATMMRFQAPNFDEVFRSKFLLRFDDVSSTKFYPLWRFDDVSGTRKRSNLCLHQVFGTRILSDLHSEDLI